MSHKTTTALMQAELDLLRANANDRDVIWAAERRIRERTHLIKMLRRWFRRRGFVNVSDDGLNPQWARGESVR